MIARELAKRLILNGDQLADRGIGIPIGGYVRAATTSIILDFADSVKFIVHVFFSEAVAVGHRVQLAVVAIVGIAGKRPVAIDRYGRIIAKGIIGEIIPCAVGRDRREAFAAIIRIGSLGRDGRILRVT